MSESEYAPPRFAIQFARRIAIIVEKSTMPRDGYKMALMSGGAASFGIHARREGLAVAWVARCWMMLWLVLATAPERTHD